MMGHNGRRVLYPPGYVIGFAHALRQARCDLAELHDRHLAEMDNLNRELDACRREFDELRAMVLARHRLDAELVGLYRERELQRATRAQRDPSQRLQ
jgi:hypothetical protein